MRTPISIFWLCIAAVFSIVGDSNAQARVSPEVFLASHQHPSFRDLARDAAVASYTTPSYTSLDQPHAVTLVFIQEQATPTGFVQLEINDRSVQKAERYSLQILDVNGVRLRLQNSLDEVFFQGGAPGLQRIAGRFDASTMASGAYWVTAVVRSYWDGGNSFLENRISVPILIVNLSNGPFGAGWSIAGLQRVYIQTDGSVLAHEGEGKLWHFLPPWSCSNPCNGAPYNSPDGDFSELRFDGMRWVRKYPDGTIWQFSISGLPEEVRDRFGNRTQFRFDGERLAEITDPAGKKVAFTYSGKLVAITDPGGRIVQTTLSGNSLYQFRDPDGVLGLDLDFAAGKLAAWWDRTASRGTGNLTRWDYGFDPHGQVSTVTSPQVTVDGVLVRPMTRVTSLEAAVLAPPGTGTYTTPAPRVLSANVQTTLTDAKGNITRFIKDRFGAPLRVERPQGQVSQAVRDEDGRATLIVSPSGDTVAIKYDGWKMVRFVDKSTRRILDYEYNENLLTSVISKADTINPMSGDTVIASYEWDDDYRGARLVFSKEGSEAHYYDYSAVWASHNLPSQPARVHGPGGHQTIFYGGLTGSTNTDSIQNSGQGRTVFTRDIYGRAIERRFTEGGLTITTRTTYDILNRVRSTTDASGSVTNYTVDNAGRVTNVVDAKGNAYGFEYNALGWLTRRTYPDGGAETYQYDLNGNTVRVTNRLNRVVSFEYDSLNMVVSRTADSQTTRWRTDPMGRFQVLANGESTDSIVVRKDAQARYVDQISVRGSQRYIVTTSYDQQGLRREVKSNDLPLAGFGPYLVGHEYENVAYGHLPRGIRVGGILSSNVAHPLERYTSLALASGDTIYRDRQTLRFNRPALELTVGEYLRRDLLGRVVARQDAMRDSTRAFAYDKSGRLSAVADSATIPLHECEPVPGSRDDFCYVPESRVQLSLRVFSYDSVGNPKHSGAVVSAGNRLAGFNGFILSYDSAGNVVRKQKPGLIDQTFEWNTLGQLIRVVTNGQAVSFGYDALGRRVRKTRPGSGETRYLYDGDDLIAELDAAGNPLSRYYYNPGTDNPHALERAGVRYYYLEDLHGNIIGLTDAAGHLVNEYTYGPFGETEVIRETVPQLFRYQARELDPESGLYYYRARYYDPSLQRFLSPDPIGLAGGINPYAYVENDPVNRSDPSGLVGQCSLVEYPSRLDVSMWVLVTAGYPCPEDSWAWDWWSRNSSRNLRDKPYNADPSFEMSYFAALEAAARDNEIADKKAQAAHSFSTGQLSDSEKIFLGVKARLAPVAPYLNGAGLAAAGGPLLLTPAMWGPGSITTLGLELRLMYPGITPTSALAPGTLMPYTFTIESGGQSFWVNSSGSKHIIESGVSRALRYPPAIAEAKMQALVASFRTAVGTAAEGGFTYDVAVTAGRWELVFGAPRAAGLLPVIYHALHRF